MSFSYVLRLNYPKAKKFVFGAIIALTSAAYLSACGEFKKSPGADPAPVKQVLETNTVGDAKFFLNEIDIPHQYQLIISWPEDTKKIVIENDGKKIFEGDSERKYILNLKDNTRFNVRAFSYDGSKPLLIGEMQGLTPKDFSLSGAIDLREDMVIEAYRIFLVNDPKIQTNGRAMNLKATKFFSDNAVITSFPSGSKASSRLNGKGGGAVFILAKQAQGHLSINLRGQHGGDGTDGLPWENRAADGAGGKSGAHDCLPLLPIGGPLKCWCTRNPENGGDGAPGLRGRSGTAGGKGGNSGEILIDVTEPSEFVVEPFQEIGLAGQPGQGGPGQEGGYGGLAGDPTSVECPSARDGGRGFTGEKGGNGPEVLDGSIETLCISIGQGEGKCQPR